MQQPFTDDPTATYRGFRRQALYCLYRVFDNGLSADTVIQPEGNEDLEIQELSGRRLEVVQVKDYSAALTVSAFKPSFYHRISYLCTNDAAVAIKIVSFGEIGPELMKAYDNDEETPKRALNTITKDREEKGKDGVKKIIKGLSEREAEVVFERLEIEVVNEVTLTEHVIEKLASTMTSGEPEVAFENLMWWLISSAEKQKRLTRSETFERLHQLGKFISQRNAHAHEWNISIKPIKAALPVDLSNKKLRNEFFQGGRVRATHVAAGLDVPRDDEILNIHRAFQIDDVVILRGASGQGKTTLSYRYLLDWAPSDFRYEVEKAASLEHARAMAAAIAGHVETIDVPTIVFIDVHPGDTLWIEFVRELSDGYGVRVLVAIREDDWFRSRVTTADFAFTDISMDFTEETGSQIYKQLCKANYGDAQLDFNDAWTKLGDRKTLFEFVYLVTQNEKLSQRVRAQIGVLRDELNRGDLDDMELHLLRLVAAASAYEARLDLKALAKFINLPEPSRALERFSHEYLLRTSADGKYVEGFHAIRSEIIIKELTDPVVQSRGAIESFLPPLVVEEDLESLLLCSFSRNEDAKDEVVKSLNDIQLNTWVGVRGVLVAFQWLGIRDYSTKNYELIKEVHSRASSGWWIALDWDLAQITGEGGGGFFQEIAKNLSHLSTLEVAVNSIQDRQSNKQEVFDFARDWLTAFKLPTNAPNSITNFSSVGEVLFWLGHLNQENKPVSDWLNKQIISDAWYALPLHLFSKFASGVRKFDSGIYDDWLSQNRDIVEKTIQAEAAIIAFVEEEDCLVSHFVIELERKASQLIPSEEEASVNDLAVQRINIVAACLPGHQRYGATGYGHRMSLLELIGDDSIRRMALENIAMPWLPEFNALARGAVDYNFRSSSWNCYFSGVRELRERVLKSIGNLQMVLSDDGNSKLLDSESWDENKQCLTNDFLLPKIAVDEWGFIAESHSDSSSSLQKKFTAISTLNSFNKTFNEYTTSLSSFFSQALQVLALVPHLRAAETKSARTAILQKGKELGVYENSIRLSVVNGMDACFALRKLQDIERALNIQGRIGFTEDVIEEELNNFQRAMKSWMLYCYPNQVFQKRPKQKKKSPSYIKYRHPHGLCENLNATKNRISHELKKLKKSGIHAKILSENVRWNGESSLWISFDTEHPLGSLVATEAIWEKLIEAFRPDRIKITRAKAIDYFWSKIILVPLVQGQSLDGHAYANMNGVSDPLDENITKQLWRFVPENIPKLAWAELGLTRWKKRGGEEIFERFSESYATTFNHVDHLADFTRCKVDLEEDGAEIFLEYARAATIRVEPFVQDTFDTCAALLQHFAETSEDLQIARPNLIDCMTLIVQLERAIHPSDDFNENGKLTFTMIADWRNRLKDGLDLVGQAHALWRADCLRLARYNYPDEVVKSDLN